MEAWTAAMRDSRVSYWAGSIAGRKWTLAVPGWMAAEPLRIMRSVPEMAMGTSRAPVCWARKKGPFLKALRRPSLERVPSGKTVMWYPSARALAAAVMEAMAASRRCPRSTGTNWAMPHGGAEDGDAHELLFEEDGGAPGDLREEDRWIEVGDVVGHEDDALPGGDVFEAGRLHADAAGLEGKADDAHGDVVERRDVLDEPGVGDADDSGERA